MKIPSTLFFAQAALASLMLAIGTTGLSAEQPKGGSHRIVGVNFSEPKQTEFLKEVLKSMNLKYKVKATPEGELVEWPSTDRAQEQEIRNRVSQFWFISTQCKGMRLPSPAQPALARLSC